MERRRIALRDWNGALVKVLDVSEIDNANTVARYTLSVETQCDMLQWHTGQVIGLDPWGEKIRGNE